MERIALISCSSRKSLKKGSIIKCLAKNLYIGSNFNKSTSKGIQVLGCAAKYYILSGKFGLLKPDDMIGWYDKYLSKESRVNQRQWAQKVLSQLKKEFPMGFEDITFVFFAGQDYYKDLLEELPHYETLKFNARQITFEIKEKK